MTYGTAAAGGAGLTVMCTALQGAPAGWKAPLATALFVFSMHLLNRMHERAGAVRFNTPEIALFYARRRGLLTAAGIAALIGAGYVAFLLGTVAGATLSALMFTGRMYAVPLPFPGLKRRCLKDIPGSKTPLVAAGWALSAAALPALGAWDTVGGGAALAFILAAGMVFWRTALSDLIDIQGDRIVGRETIPILVGAARTTKALNVMPACMAILVILWGLAGGSPAACIAALACLGLFAVCFRVYARRRIVDRLLFEGLLDAIFVLAGLLTIALGKNGL
jgi:4-hydroxy-3-methylbut-2-enyl diphosphate reductase